MRLHWKLMLTYLSVVVLVLAGVHLYVDRAIPDVLVGQMAASLTREANLAQAYFSARYPPDAPEDMDRLADDVGQRLGVRVTVIDRTGRVLGDSAVPLADVPGLENHADRPEVQAAWRTGQGSSVRFSQTISSRMLYVALAERGDASGRFVLRLAMPLRNVTPMKQPISRAIWMASVLGLGLALLLAYGSSRYVSRPIVDMTRVAHEVASGVFTHSAPNGATSQELRELAGALDEMRRQIQVRIGQMTLEKSRLEAVLTGITEGILVTEQNGRVSMANRAFAKLFGVVSDPVGRMPIELVRHHDVQEAIDRTLKTGQVVFLELTLSDGLERHLDVHVAPIFQNGMCIGTVTVFYDITELRRLERIRKDFVANVSHELRTPLTTIKGCAATLAEGALEDPSAARRFVQMINTHADRLHNLVEDVLDLSRMESGKLVLKVDVHSVRRLVELAVGQVKPRADEKRLELVVDVSGNLQVRCDPKLIEQALLNLLDNAVKYTPEGGRVCVQTRAFSRDENVRRRFRTSPESPDVRRAAQAEPAPVKSEPQRIAIEVKDSGIGIPLASMPRIFERFYRVDQGRSRAMGGTGLGLSIVRHIMEAHGERVYVESELGKGSTFGLTLPVA